MAELVRRSELDPSLTRWDPLLWDPFEMMRDLSTWDPFQRMLAPWSGRDRFVPSFEVRETPDSYLFKADLPGVKEEDLDISVTGNRLTITGKRQEDGQNLVDLDIWTENPSGQKTTPGTAMVVLPSR